MNENGFQRCEGCADPTRYVTGFWDGRDPKTGRYTHGVLTDCRNEKCPVKQAQMKSEEKFRKERQRVQEENAANGISADILRGQRRLARVSMRTAAEIAGVKVSHYSDLENERAAIPPKVHERLMDYFKKKEEQNER